MNHKLKNIDGENIEMQKNKKYFQNLNKNLYKNNNILHTAHPTCVPMNRSARAQSEASSALSILIPFALQKQYQG